MADQRPHRRDVAQAGANKQAAVPSTKAAPKPAAAKRTALRATPAASRRKSEATRRSPIKVVAVVLGVLAALALVSGIAIAVLANTSAFQIASIDAAATEHISSADIAALASVPEGTTLLNYDEEAIRQNVCRNPWVGEVSITREFPDKLKVSVTERKVGMLVMLESGAVIWCMGTDGVWIEPVKVPTAEGQSVREAALGVANSLGALLVTDAPQTVSPTAGAPAEDEVFAAINTYREELSESFSSQIVSVSAPSMEAISCILSSGVEVSLGAPTNVETKEAVVQQLLAKYPNRITYINVRVPSSPSYRMLESESVQEGTGAMGDATPQP